MTQDNPRPEGSGKKFSASFITGAIALVFLVTGYQTALFVHRAATARIIANRDAPDTVYVVDRALAREILEEMYGESGSSGTGVYSGGSSIRGTSGSFGSFHEGSSTSSTSGSGTSSATGSVVVRRNSQHSPQAQKVREQNAPRSFECFPFDPNTVSVEDLQRLGFTLKQAQSIDNYRSKGGRFRRKSDFAKSYVVADSVYERLEPYINIPLLDINAADSAAFDALPGIGPYFAAKMVSYRAELGGYSFKEQLMDIRGFDEDKFAGLEDLIRVGSHPAFPLWTAPEDSLKLHPYISSYAAHGIVLYRKSNPHSAWTVEGLARAGILPSDLASKLSRCLIVPAE